MKVSKTDIKEWLGTAKKACLLSGGFLLNNRRLGGQITRDFKRDIKIAADIESEKIIIDFLQGKSDFSILSEEKGLILGKDTRFIWIVDPLDGTYNYLRDIPFCCVSIALWQKNKPLLGIIYDFNRSEMFCGIIGKGAWLNGRPLQISSVDRKEKAILCTGFPANTDFSKKGIKEFVDSVQSYKKVRLLGSAALSMAYVACGRADVYYEKDIMFWDVAAGVPIVLSAGGSFKMQKASKDYSYHIRVSNGCLKAAY